MDSFVKLANKYSRKKVASRRGMFICSNLRQNLSEMESGHCKDTESNLGPFAGF